MKEKIAIMTDSTSDIPRNIVEEYNIQVVPLRILYKDAEYRDQVDISAEEVYRNLPIEVPSTSLPSPAEVLDLFERLKRGLYPCFGHSHFFGSEWNWAANRKPIPPGGGLVIKVIDSKNISMGLGYTVMRLQGDWPERLLRGCVHPCAGHFGQDESLLRPGDAGISDKRREDWESRRHTRANAKSKTHYYR